MYSFYPTVVVRSPRLAFAPDTLTECHLRQLLHESWFLEAIYLASPDLYRTAVAWRDGADLAPRKEAKLLASLYKYHSRMMSRATPFGLLASCGVVGSEEVCEDTNHLKREPSMRHTRLDMHFSGALALALTQHPTVRVYLTYFPNSSLYPVGDELRYIDYQYVEGKRVHQISAVGKSEALEALIQKAQTGATLHELIAALVSDSISVQEAGEFVEQVISAQLLVSNLTPTITGGDFEAQVQAVLEEIALQSGDDQVQCLGDTLSQIRRLLAQLDANKVNEVADYERIISLVKRFDVPFEEGKLFQVDLSRDINGVVCEDTNHGDVDGSRLKREPQEARVSNANHHQGTNKHQKEIWEALEVLNRLNQPKPNPTLQDFITRFEARYEQQEIPLLLALDTEVGVGYLSNQNAAYTPLLEGLELPVAERTTSMAWDATQDFFFEKFQIALANQEDEIVIEDEEMNKFPKADWETAPPSFSVMYRVVNDSADRQCILLESAGGASALQLLGRFAHTQEALLEATQSIADTEQAQNPDIIFAEIIHLPEHRTGNILLHPPFQRYEIPFLGKSSLPLSEQIPLQDLYVSVQDGQVVLRSRQLNKLVIPRLSTAHNYSFNALPIYQFLCDLQHQGLRTRWSLSLGELAEKCAFFPRIRYKNVILRAATWHGNPADIACVANAQLGNSRDICEPSSGVSSYFLVRRGAVRRAVRSILVEGDNELLIDWHNPLSIAAWEDATKNSNKVTLKEFLPHSRGKHFHQYITMLVRTKAAQHPQNLPMKLTNNASVQRTFIVGSEWLYLKLYGGVKVADKVLTEYIRPLCDALKTNALIDRWFFIRYNDPEPHLRLRLHLPNPTQIGKVMAIAYQYLQPAVEMDYLYKIQTDTYIRELERYGFEQIEEAEALFHGQSESVLAFLAETEGDLRDEIRWQWGVAAIDGFLDLFDYTLSQKKS
ncbi:MAG: lantibiotic dehydratase, partial [Spirosomaceae bacterium]|nr:lantibiotic dehydratase [Spirosomataceae bacterium]